jgi:hypothetical protein
MRTNDDNSDFQSDGSIKIYVRKKIIKMCENTWKALKLEYNNRKTNKKATWNGKKSIQLTVWGITLPMF